MQTTCLIDPHVHIYPHYDVALLLNTAAATMGRISTQAGQGDALQVLMLTETARHSAFAQLANGQTTAAGWSVTTHTNDPTALTLTNDNQSLLLVAGRQIVTAERLEVLAMGTAATFDDGQPMADVLDGLKASGTPAVLPWGVGKWVGKRGKIIDALIRERGSDPGLLLGDNGGRPRGLPTPGAFKTAQGMSVPVLPGTDPLPIVGAEKDVAQNGLWLTTAIDPARPGDSLRQALFDLRGQPKAYGQRKGLLAVIKDQRALRSNRQG